jgi:hypothetical protein
MKKESRIYTSILAAFCCVPLITLAGATSASAKDSAGEPGRHTGETNPLKNVYFGEQHLHTQDSPDAFAMGVRNSQDDAFNFAKGLPIKKVVGDYTVQKKTPYDWCAVTDHAVMMGLMPMTLDKSSPLYKTKVGELIRSGTAKDLNAAFGIIMTSVQKGHPPEGFDNLALQKTAWDIKKKNANKHNDPGKFTTLIAFEWTSIPYGQNLHRNVFFRDDEGPDMPFSTLDSDRAEDLWTYLAVQRNSGHETFAIPHNSNLSNGLMFPNRNSYGQPIDAGWMKRRALNEIAIEILQTKGTSDTHPALSPGDEFAAFEGEFKHLLGTGGVVGKVVNSFYRGAIIDGVGWQESEGVNPHKFGVVAGADAHTGFSDNEEFNYTGVHGINDATIKARLSGAGQTAGEAAIMFGTPGATAVWAPENTRTAIFDGIRSKETYGTSGPLIRLRFFGGWDYDKGLVDDVDFVKKAYASGVPMGGDLLAKPAAAKAPTFAVWALKDPDSGNLDRVQIIKGWYENGYPWEQVYDVAWSDGRKRVKKGGENVRLIVSDGMRAKTVYREIPEGKLPRVGNTVDIKTATYTNTIGDNELSAVWTDPNFDPSQHAVYYVRAIEIPTPRWSTYDAAAQGVEPSGLVPATIQERAWSSPIWYTPEPALVKKAHSYPGLRDYLTE